MSSIKFAGFLKIHPRTLSDWKREKFLIPYRIATRLSRLSKILLPRGILVRDKLKDVTRAARLGGLAIVKKYRIPGGDPEKRKKAWRKWWERDGKSLFKNKKFGKRKNIHIPSKTSKLAEFVGIMLGDGGMTNRQISIALNRETDSDYVYYVRKLLRTLFHTNPSILCTQKDKALDVVISRTDLVEFCKKIGLVVGNKIKQKIDIPQWIKNKKEFWRPCIRGLVDTDGCLVIHRYTVKGKKYIYKKLFFSSASPPLIGSVTKMLQDLFFHPRISKSRRQIWLDGQNEVKRYMSVIGTSNLKHRNRFRGEVCERLKQPVC